ncbi:MAG: hypothetical protein MJ138_07635 [Kiritimatiellae bacterium]|nr:hypothetical protein [Kiritimatiellia bacterium]
MKKTLLLAAVLAAGGLFAAEDVNLYWRVADRKALTAAAQKLSNEIGNPMAGPMIMGAVKGVPAGKLFAIDLLASNPAPRVVKGAAALAAHPLAPNELARVWLSAACKRALEKRIAEEAAKDQCCDLDALAYFDDATAAIETTAAGIGVTFAVTPAKDGALAKSKAAKLSAAQLAFKDVPDNAHAFAVQNDLGLPAVSEKERKALTDALFGKKDGVFPQLVKAADDAKSKALIAAAEKGLRNLIEKMPDDFAGLRSTAYAATDAEGRFKYHVAGSGSAKCAKFCSDVAAECAAFFAEVRKAYPNETAFVDFRHSDGNLDVALDAAKAVKAAEVDDPAEAKAALKVVQAILGGKSAALTMRVKGDVVESTLAGADFKDGKSTGRAARKLAKSIPEAVGRKDLTCVSFASFYTIVRNLALGVIKRGFEPAQIAPYEPILNQLPDTGDAGIGIWSAVSPARVEGALRISYGEIRGIAALVQAGVSYQMTVAMSASDDEDDDDADDDADDDDDAKAKAPAETKAPAKAKAPAKK